MLVKQSAADLPQPTTPNKYPFDGSPHKPPADQLQLKELQLFVRPQP